MKKQNSVAEDIIENLKQRNDTKNYYIILLTFDKKSFYKKLTSVSQFFKVLTNGKNMLGGLGSNREWWSVVRGSGFYRMDTTLETINLFIYLESEAKINETEFRYRVRRLVPSTVITFMENKLDYIKANQERLTTEASVELFGNYKKSLYKN